MMNESTRRRIPLRALLGVMLLVACFVLAITMRRRAMDERKPPQQPVDEVVAPADVRPPGEALLMRIVRPGEAAATLERASTTAPWIMRDVAFSVDQSRVARLVSVLEKYCGGELYAPPPKEARVQPAAEVLVGQHLFRLLEHERGVLYTLERAGRACQPDGEYVQLFDAEHVGVTATQWRDLRLLPVEASEISAVHFAALEGESGLVLVRQPTGIWRARGDEDEVLREVQVRAMLDGLVHLRAVRVEPLDVMTQGLTQEAAPRKVIVEREGGEPIVLWLGGTRAVDPLGKDYERFIRLEGNEDEVFVTTKYPPRQLEKSLADFIVSQP